MADLFFYLFASLIIASSVLVVASRSAINSAMFLLLCLAGVSGLFVLLDAFLLAVLMILVYAGAVVALFLFIIMLLDVKGGHLHPPKKSSLIASGFALVLLVLGVFSFVQHGQLAQADLGTIVPLGSNMKLYAEMLFTTYLLPVQIMGFLLLIAMLGVIVLSKRFENLGDIK